MKIHHLQDTVRGWFIGSFCGALFHSDAVEVAVKHYRRFDWGQRHYHALSTEFTVVVSGELLFGNKRLSAGDIAEVAAHEEADLLALEDSVTVVVKLPAVLGDKYYT